MAKIQGYSVVLDFISLNFVALELEPTDFATQVELEADEYLQAIEDGNLKYIEVGGELILAASKEWLGNVGNSHEISRRS